MIANCSIDENGKISGGKAGDQTGKEWVVRNWYQHKYGWTCVLRHPNSAVREWIAKNSEDAAKNNKIGYDQGQRSTYWTQLKASKYLAKDIKVACETDCSASTSANIKAAGYILGITDLKNFPVGATTRNIKGECEKRGFTVLTAKKYLANDTYLLRGDIILSEGHHVCVNLTDGKSLAEPKKETPKVVNTPQSSAGGKGTCNVEVPVLKKGSTGGAVRTWQSLLEKKFGIYCGGVDGSFGPTCDQATRNFQARYGLKADGSVGPATWTTALNR